MKNNKSYSQKILELLAEVERYEALKEKVNKSSGELFSDYQRGRLNFSGYEKIQRRLLGGRTKKEWDAYYDSYTLSLLKQIENLNQKIFSETYAVRIFGGEYHEKLHEEVSKPVEAVEVNVESIKEIPQIKPEPQEHADEMPEAPKRHHAEEKKAEAVQIIEQQVVLPHAESSLIKWIKLRFGAMPEAPHRVAKRQVFQIVEKVPEPLSFKEEKTPYMKTSEYLSGLVSRIFGLRKETYISKAAEAGVPKETIMLRSRRGAAVEVAKAEVAPTLLAEEAARIKRIMEKQVGLKVYKPSLLGSVANVSIKKISFFLIDAFPDFFRYLYNALRSANVQMLSNTYVNIMVLMSIFTFIISMIIFPFLFTLSNNLTMTLTKSFMSSVILMLITFMGFYAYPFSKIRRRRVNIRANLPFAINHMAAVASSGVPPTKMFHLIAKSNEYGEVSVEVEKIVEYIELFGYDLLTALKSVAAISPSDLFKEFMEGMISTTESGGDIKVYMMEKSKEAMLEYELEREKYTETISTYSDIYTGVLIAAPLFFVATLSLVSLLGGTIGGIGIDVVIVVGTYVVIPLLNGAFLMFLIMTQPEI